jgi:hypothetical protein
VEKESVSAEKKQRLAKNWFSVILDTYPAESKAFFQKNKDAFANPVGNTIKRNIDCLTEAVLHPAVKNDYVKDALEPIIRIRAVQEFSISQALAFIFEFKTILRKEIPSLLKTEEGRRYVETVDANIDAVMLAALDIYMACKHTVYTLRINEAKKNVRQLLIKKNMMCEIPDAGLEITR